jgi:GTPase SAR1 family protein
MPKYGQLVLGPAGSGKSTYCGVVQENFEVKGRKCHVVNLDPAAENSAGKYEVAGDIRELIVAKEVSEQLDLGPNGGLVAAMEFLIEQEGLDWLEELIDSFNEDDYLMFDMPGQIELYSHIPVVKRLAEFFIRKDIRVAVVYCIDAMFVTDVHKFVAGCLASLSAMVAVELPCVNLLTKCDLLGKADEDVRRSLADMDFADIRRALRTTAKGKYLDLNERIVDVLEEYAMIKFLEINNTDEESVDAAIVQINNVIAYGEDLEPRDQDYLAGEMQEMADQETV